jgi:hypothetical protein
MEFIKGSHAWSTTYLIGYIQTIEVPTLHNRGVLIRYKTSRQIGKDNEGNDHKKITHWCSSMMDHD